ncbi:hypothetical protein [Niabella aurantiaca]|uniref:hypothetical protein n=1 Tax=Niabella aurantiaca TaxID=379900 RepID=UPI000382449E|nr:hypothetical protein [Niabella aurantiaca]
MINKNNEILSIVYDPAPINEFDWEKPLEGPSIFDEDEFKPSYHFLHLVKSHPFQCLMYVLDNNTLEDLHTQWSEWVHCTVCAEYSAFSDDMDRKFLLRFAVYFHLLMDAVHFTLSEWFKMKKKKVFVSDKNAVYKYLQETSNAYRQILDITSKYAERKARIYLWSVLDCVLGYGGHFNIDRKNILFEYESLLCMLRAPYHMIRLYPALFDLEEEARGDASN